MKTDSWSWREVIDQIERPIYYTVLLAYFLITLITEVTTLSWKWLDSSKNLLFPAVLLIVFRYFDRLARSSPGIKEYGKELGISIAAAVKRSSHVANLQLLACTSVKYFVLIKDMGIRVKAMTLLLPSDAALNQMEFLTSDVRQQLIKEKARTIENWKSLVIEGRVENLVLEEFAFTPIVHGMIIDESEVVFGFFQPLKGKTGLQTMEKFVATTQSSTGRALVRDWRNLFESISQCAIQRTSFTAPAART